MATSTIIEPNYLSKFFLNQLEDADPSFNRENFLGDFDALAKNMKVALVFNLMQELNLFLAPTPDLKNDVLANEHRLKGNKYFYKGDYAKALEEYNHSITLTSNDETLSLAYGNRSACFHKLRMRDQCGQDIHRALAHNYPASKVKKLNERLEKALQMETIEDKYYEIAPEIPSDRKNSIIQCASDYLKLVKDDAGRNVCVVAAKDIEIGDVLAVEKPYACVTFTDDRLSHCHHCQKLCYNMLPCEGCTQAMFCGEECRQEARCDYHKYECSILRTINELTKKNTMLSIALRAVFKAMMACFSNQSSDDIRHYKSDRFYEIGQLQSAMVFTSLDELHEAVLTSMVLKLLHGTGYFSVDPGQEERIMVLREIMFETLLFEQLLVTRSSASKIYDYVHSNNMHETINFAFGLYSFFSVFRHSCSAHIMKSYHGTTMVLRAINTIKKGEECFVNRYGLRYDVFTLPVRDHLLIISRLPKCKCIACSEDWKSELGDLKYICRGLGIHPTTFVDIVKRVIGKNMDAAAMLLPHLISMLKECEGNEPRGNALTLKRLIVHCFVIYGNKRLL